MEIIWYSFLQVRVYEDFFISIPSHHSFKNYNFPIYFFIWIPNFWDNVSNWRHIVSENNATKQLNEACHKNLFPITLSRKHIAKTNSHHNCSPPIISINIFYEPYLVLYSGSHHPTPRRVKFGHSQQNRGHEMSKKEIKKDNFQ